MSEYKKCRVCGEEKDINSFPNRKGARDGKRSECESCYKDKQKEYYIKNKEKIICNVKKYRERNEEKVKKYQAQYRLKNIDKKRAYHKEYRAKNRERLLEYGNAYYEANRDSMTKYFDEYRDANRDTLRERYRDFYERNKDRRVRDAVEYKKRRRNNGCPKLKSSEIARHALRRVFDLIGVKKKSKSFDILGYDGEDLSKWLEAQFEKGMTWKNHGEWHVDHIVPVSILVDSGIEDPKIINSLINLRPLWKKDNLSRRFTELNGCEMLLFDCITLQYKSSTS